MRHWSSEAATRPDLPPQARSALTALADVEHRFAVEREHLSGWKGPTPARARLMSHLEARNRKDREALLQRVAHLAAR